MIVYKRKVSHSIGKFLLAATIFVLAMTITWDEVEGSPSGAIDTISNINLVSSSIIN